MGECGNTSLGSSVALCLRLAHAVARRRDVYYRCSLGKIRGKQLDKIERSGNTDCQGILKLIPCAFVQTLHQRQGIVDDIIHLAILPDYFICKSFQHLLLGYIPNEMVALTHINDSNRSPSLSELLCDTFADAMCTACYYC